MGKREGYAERLDALIAEALAGKSSRLDRFLLEESNLPGPRGNLELADAFADASVRSARALGGAAVALARRLAGVESPPGDAHEFLAFCGVQALGALGGSGHLPVAQAVALLRPAARDGRWRVREACARGLQLLLDALPEKAHRALAGWRASENLLEQRALVAGFAEPRLLREGEGAARALAILRRAAFEVLAGSDAAARASDEFRVLRQALEYAFSVVVVAEPKAGFAALRELSLAGDPDLLRVLRENLKKARLLKAFPAEVLELSALAGPASPRAPSSRRPAARANAKRALPSK